MSCNVFWGSHGCDLEPHDTGQHVCDCCTPRKKHRARHDAATSMDQVEFKDGVICVGTWPYYGPATAFFTYQDKHFVDLPGELERLAALKEGEHDGAG